MLNYAESEKGGNAYLNIGFWGSIKVKAAKATDAAVAAEALACDTLIMTLRALLAEGIIASKVVMVLVVVNVRCRMSVKMIMM